MGPPPARVPLESDLLFAAYAHPVHSKRQELDDPSKYDMQQSFYSSLLFIDP